MVGDEALTDIRELKRAKALITAATGLSADAVFECRLALSEAVANALTHGRGEGTCYCRVRVECERILVRITVEDHGPGFQWQGMQRSMPDPRAEHGRGIHLIRLLVDHVYIRSTPQGTCVEMIKLLPGIVD